MNRRQFEQRGEKSEIEQASYCRYDEGCCVEGESLYGNRIPRVNEPPMSTPRRPVAGLNRPRLKWVISRSRWGRNVNVNPRTILVIVPDILRSLLQ